MRFNSGLVAPLDVARKSFAVRFSQTLKLLSKPELLLKIIRGPELGGTRSFVATDKDSMKTGKPTADFTDAEMLNPRLKLTWKKLH